jgi:serine/threonine-protein kinase 24/25/MST4
LDLSFCPAQRPGAKELLQHRFVKSAGRTTILTELIERHQLYKARAAQRGGQQTQGLVLPSVTELDASLDGSSSSETMQSDWSFGTAASGIAAVDDEANDGLGPVGTIRRSSPGPVVRDEDLESEDDEDNEAGVKGLSPGHGRTLLWSEASVHGSTLRGPVRGRGPIRPLESKISG